MKRPNLFPIMQFIKLRFQNQIYQKRQNQLLFESF